MKPALFQAIDKIGDRFAARMDWETMSGLPWNELKPYLVPAHGRYAQEVYDPEDPSQMLVVWPLNDTSALLESPQIPALRKPREVQLEKCIMYRLDITRLSDDLATPFDFIPTSAKKGMNLHYIGIQQVPGRQTTDVFLLIPLMQGSSVRSALRLILERGEKQTIVLLPSARWMKILPRFPRSFQVRVLSEYLQTAETETLIASAHVFAPNRQHSPKSLQVRKGDTWRELTVTCDFGTGRIQLTLGNRNFSTRIWTENNTNNMFILSVLASHNPPSWNVAELAKQKIHRKPRTQDALRQAFLRFQNKLVELAPIQDGKPFNLDPITNTHSPKFQLKAIGLKEVLNRRHRAIETPPQNLWEAQAESFYRRE